MIAFRSCFHLLAFPVQSATQSGAPPEEILTLVWRFSGEEKPGEPSAQSTRILAFFTCAWQTRNRRKL
jgi:hypothetical protein